jgi:hypothetical protein
VKKYAAVFAMTALLCGVGGRVEAEESTPATPSSVPWLTDLVSQQGEIMTLEQGHVCLLSYADRLGTEETREIRVQTRIEAPAQGVISRDNLVVLSTELLHGALSDPSSELLAELPAGYTLLDLACTRLFDKTQPFDFALDVVLPDTPDPADPLQAERQADLVTQHEGKFVWNQTEACAVVEMEGEGSLHVFWLKAHMEAPQQDVISRDHFVALTTEILTEVEEQFAQRFFGGAGSVPTALECSPRPAADEAVDVEVNVSMTHAQIQVETTETTSGLKAQQINSWAQVFPVPADASQNLQSVQGPKTPFRAAAVSGMAPEMR